MLVTVKGGTKQQRADVQDIATFVGLKLLHPKTFPQIELDIDLLPNLYKTDGNIGDVIWEDTHYRPKWFTMQVDSSVNRRRMLETVAHEMVHVQQFATGRLVERSNDTRWEGKVLKKQPDYWDRPWEIEAHGRELGLFLTWVQDRGLADQAWTWDDLDKYKQEHE